MNKTQKQITDWWLPQERLVVGKADEGNQEVQIYSYKSQKCSVEREVHYQLRPTNLKHCQEQVENRHTDDHLTLHTYVKSIMHLKVMFVNFISIKKPSCNAFVKLYTMAGTGSFYVYIKNFSKFKQS